METFRQRALAADSAAAAAQTALEQHTAMTETRIRAAEATAAAAQTALAQKTTFTDAQKTDFADPVQQLAEAKQQLHLLQVRQQVPSSTHVLLS